MLFVICSTTWSYLFFKLSCLDMVLISGSAYLCPKPASGYCNVVGMLSCLVGDNSIWASLLLALVEKAREPGGFEFFDEPAIFMSSLIA